MANEAMVSFGTQSTTNRLFSYPNLGHEADSLENTIKHYLVDSLVREGLPTAIIDIQIAVDSCLARISGLSSSQAAEIQQRYQAFFDAGLQGLIAFDKFAVSGKLDTAWQFLLPLGVPLAFAQAVEIMDFPPTTLIQKQDYLNSKTTGRWWELLTVNSVSQADLARYSCILDIVPVAAPASDGSKLDASGIYMGPFDSYGLPQLDNLSKVDSSTARRPLIALGMPIRNWIERVWGMKLGVLDVGTLEINSGDYCPVIVSNHPSFFFYAVHSNTGPGAAQKNLAAGLAVMKQDIVAAAWHASMGRDPRQDPKATLTVCQAQWTGRDAELMDLVKKQSGIVELLATESSVESLGEITKLMPDKNALADLESRFEQARSLGDPNCQR